VKTEETQQADPVAAVDTPTPNTPQPKTKGPIVRAKGAATADPKLTVNLEDKGTEKSGGGAGLSEAMKSAVGPIDLSNQAQAASASDNGGQAGNVPQKPSQGMVQGAVNGVLPEARGCLGPDDPVSKASVVFQSDGSVKTVSVTGSASGKPAEQCIRNALSKAKVQPFAEPMFSFPVTIRPNG
jgi:hypothetical protein